MELKTIIKCLIITLYKIHHASYIHIFRNRFSFLEKWIYEHTKKLDNFQKLKLSTRICWILNDYKDFPKCNWCNEYIKTWFTKNIPITHKYPHYCKLHAHCNDESREKMRQTLSNMPQEHWDIALQKRTQTCLSSYGVENVSQLPEIIDKITNSISAHYGVKRASQLDGWREKTIASNRSRYGVDWYPQSEQYAISLANTLQTTYHENVINPFQLSFVITKSNKKRYRKYKYDNKYFDSAPEVAYYIWLTDHKVQFEYHPIFAKFTYITSDNRIHRYCPDFYLIKTQQFIEIKGSQFFDKNGNFKDPYNKKHPEDAHAKYQCMIDNNVKILTYKTYKIFLRYASRKYGSTYIKSFRV